MNTNLDNNPGTFDANRYGGYPRQIDEKVQDGRLVTDRNGRKVEKDGKVRGEVGLMSLFCFVLVLLGISDRSSRITHNSKKRRTNKGKPQKGPNEKSTKNDEFRRTAQLR